MNFQSQIPIVDFHEEEVVRPGRIIYKSSYDNQAVVIDNGSYNIRAGFSSDKRPLIDIRNQMLRPKARYTNESASLVGEMAGSRKGISFGKAAARSAFDRNVVVNYDIQETVLDYVFDRLSINDLSHHPIMMTECCANPQTCREQMLELLFETYEVPSVCFLPDIICAYICNRHLNNFGENGILLGSGHSATHALAIVDGEPNYRSMIRSAISGEKLKFNIWFIELYNFEGSVATDHFQQLLQLRYPDYASSFSIRNVEKMKKDFCVCSLHFDEDLENMRTKGDRATDMALGVRLAKASEKALNREKEVEASNELKYARLQEQKQRMREMAEKRKIKTIQEKEEYLNFLTNIESKICKLESGEEVQIILEGVQLQSQEELKKQKEKTLLSLLKLRGDNNATLVKEEKVSLGISDLNNTSGNLVGIKRKHKGYKDKLRDEDLLLAEDREGYIQGLRIRYSSLSEKLKERRRKRLGGSAGNKSMEHQGIRSSRITEEQRQRMKLMVRAVKEDKKDSCFGMDDCDWEVYRAFDKNNSDSEEEKAEAAEIEWIESRLQELGEISQGGNKKSERENEQHMVGEEINLSMYRIRIPELLFQPTLAGIDQAGVAEMISRVLKQLPKDVADKCSANFLLVGANCSFPNFELRLKSELVSIFPANHDINIVKSPNLSLDAWYGAALASLSQNTLKNSYTLEDYREYGKSALKFKSLSSCSDII